MNRSTLLMGFIALSIAGLGVKAIQSYSELIKYGNKMQQAYGKRSLKLVDVKQKTESDIDMSMFIAIGVPLDEETKTTWYYFLSADDKKEAFSLRVEAFEYDKNYKTNVFKFKGKTHTADEWIKLTGANYSNLKEVKKEDISVHWQHMNKENTR